jgi:hypothetical protein
MVFIQQLALLGHFVGTSLDLVVANVEVHVAAVGHADWVGRADLDFGAETS